MKLEQGANITINTSVRGCGAALDYSIGACEADADRHCLAVQPGEGRLLRCIQGKSVAGQSAVLDGA
jgi:hypothetical protein